MNTTSASEPQEVPDLILEQYRLGELPRADADRVTRLLSVDRTLRDRHDALEQSDEAFAREYRAGWLARRLQARLAAPPGPGIRWSMPLGLAAAAVLVLFVMPRVWINPSRTAVVSQTPDDRIKGLRPALTIYRRTASGSETLADGSVARAGDLVRLGYTGAGRSYGVILSIDGRGIVTLHLPPGGDHAAPLQSGHTALLDQAYELDDAPGWERFYFVTGDTPFPVAPIVEAARKVAAEGARLAPPPLPIGRELTQSTFSVQKEVRR
jgi:hypothetical protein